jgi:hypothetical protein
MTAGPGIAELVVPMPGGVRPPTDSPDAMIAWLFRHGAPRTGEALSRMRRQGWTVELPEPDAAEQTELWATGRFGDLEQARAAARPFAERVAELMRWTPADRAAEATRVPVVEPREP